MDCIIWGKLMRYKGIKFLIFIVVIMIIMMVIFLIEENIKFDTKNILIESSECDIYEKYKIKNNYKANIFLDEKNKCYTIELIIDIINDSTDEWNKIYFRDYPSAFYNLENGNISEISEVKDFNKKEELRFYREEDKTVFYIQLKELLKPNTTITISMKYKAYIPNLDARYGYQKIGENKTDFEETVNLLQSLPLDFISCFAYSEHIEAISAKVFPKVHSSTVLKRIEILSKIFGNKLKIYQ